jgi:hypothetical protein
MNTEFNYALCKLWKDYFSQVAYSSPRADCPKLLDEKALARARSKIGRTPESGLLPRSGVLGG